MASEKPMASESKINDALRAVWDSISYVVKTGRHSGQGGSFAYATESDVKREFHRLFLRHGLLFSLNEKSVEIRPHINKEEKHAGYLAILTAEITLLHVESGESVSYQASGVGYDSTDKAIGKAYSYLVKTWLLNNFLIETTRS